MRQFGFGDRKTIMKMRVLVLAGIIMISTITARADFSEAKWQYYKEIDFKGREMGYWLAVVDGEIHDSARSNLSDLRIITTEGKEIPYKVVIRRIKVTKVPHHARMFNLSCKPGSQTTFMLDMGSERLFHNRLKIHTSNKNFWRGVELSGSEDQENWYLLREKAYVFDFSEDYHAARTEVKYPETNYRYLKVVIWDDGEKSLSVTGASVSRCITKKADEVELNPAHLSLLENDQRRATELLFDFGVKGKPCHRALLEFDEVNYHRQVEISGSNDRENWKTFATKHIYHIETEKYRGKETEIEFEESQYRYLCLSILNYDDKPLKFGRASLWGTPRKVVFNREPDTTYRLYYGNTKAGVPRYDLARIIPHVNLDGSPIAELVPQTRNPTFRGPWTEENAWVLWAAIIVVVGSLAAVTFRSIRQISDGKHP